MGTPYMSEIRIMSFNFPPKGWALCNGQLLSIAQNQALFSLLGTQYGGNGTTTFGLPNLQGRAPVHFGAGSFADLGQSGGEASHTLSVSEIPPHNHVAQARAANGTANVSGITPAPTKAAAQALVSLQNNQTTPAQMYGTGQVDRTMSSAAIGQTGGSQPHENMQPYLTLSFCIALQGIFPSRN